MTIRIAIVGYGNLGRGVQTALAHQPDMALAGIFTRRDPATVRAAIPAAGPVLPLDAFEQQASEIDVAILCGGSRTDLPEQSPRFAALTTIVDSFDTHAKIPQHFAAVDAAARQAGTTALISTGWDPGLFSLMRALGEAVLPRGETYTFWGSGVSQGHSDAIRRIPGVAAAVQYTVPIDTAAEAVRSGSQPRFSTRDKHRRDCFVVLDTDSPAERDRVREAIVTMPDYFADYDTTVQFLSAAELATDHGGMPHGGFVMRSGETSPGARQLVELRLQLDSNPEFTASVLVACARAAFRLAQRGEHGAKTIYDVPLGLLSPLTPEELRASLL